MRRKSVYKGLGFVEVLVAIVVVGIASSVFLTIAGKSLKSLLKNEEIEFMARLARDGSNIAQEIANADRANIFGESQFPTDSGCYIPTLDPETGVHEFKRNQESNQLIRFDYSRELAIENGITIQNDANSYFRVMCIEEIEEDGKWVTITLHIGNPRYEGNITGDKDLKDYEYQTIIKL